MIKKISDIFCLYALAKVTNDDGISAIEYSIIAAAIALVILTAAPPIGAGIDARMNTVETAISP